VRLAAGISKKFADLALNPKITARMLVNRIHSYSTLKKMQIYSKG
jgi:hypothetical protein